MSDLCFDNLALKPDDIDTVMYHGPHCPDGFVSAYAAWKYAKGKGKEDKLAFYPLAAGSTRAPKLSGKNILMADLCIDIKAIKKLLENNNLIILDHHKTALPVVKELDPSKYVVTMGNSGAYITWKYFFPDTTVPKLVEYVQDRDIWTNEMEYTKEFTAWFSVQKFTFELCESIIDDDICVETIKKEGPILTKHNEYYIQRAVESSTTKMIKLPNGEYYFIALSNTAILKSDIGNALLEHHDYADFSMAYDIDNWDDTTRVSLRSTDKHTDVSKIAKYFYGGGHRNASGLGIGTIVDKLPGKVIGNGYILNEILKLNTKYNKLTNSIYLESNVSTKHLCVYLSQVLYSDENSIKYGYDKYVKTTDKINYVIGNNNITSEVYLVIMPHINDTDRDKIIDDNDDIYGGHLHIVDM